MDISGRKDKTGNSKVTINVLIKYANAAGLYKSGNYKDDHLHLELPQSKGNEKNYKEKTVPFIKEDEKENEE